MKHRTSQRAHLSAHGLALLAGLSLLPATLPAQTFLPDQQHLFFKADDTKACLKCHGMANFAFRDSSLTRVRDLSVAAAAYNASVHGSLHCQQCHPEVKEYPHRFEPARKVVGCGDDCHATDPKGAPYTHAKVADEFGASVHGATLKKKNSDAPTCLSCHGKGSPHAIVKARKAVTITEKMALCVTCHDDHAVMTRNKVTTEAVSSYKRSFHYKAIRFGETNTAVCQDCHTVHGVLPRDSARSTIAPANVARTCGQDKCHPGANMNFAMSGANHLGLRIEREPLLWFMENFFLVLTLGTLVMLLVGIALDVQRKYGWLALAGKGTRAVGRRTLRLTEAARPALRFAKRILID
ncbi:MAG: hypothetical protein IPP94_10180 [Ignavibacteria bacterium]|nr:hypothetical protein [Ignavibacteria bacterium]